MLFINECKEDKLQIIIYLKKFKSILKISFMYKCTHIFYEGSRPPGEYFNPGYDCLDILNKNEKAKDGYYWVDFHRLVPYKV